MPVVIRSADKQFTPAPGQKQLESRSRHPDFRVPVRRFVFLLSDHQLTPIPSIPFIPSSQRQGTTG